MAGKKTNETCDAANLERRKLRAETRLAEQEEAFRLPLFWMDWLETSAIPGAILVKVLSGVQ